MLEKRKRIGYLSSKCSLNEFFFSLVILVFISFIFELCLGAEKILQWLMLFLIRLVKIFDCFNFLTFVFIVFDLLKSLGLVAE